MSDFISSLEEMAALRSDLEAEGKRLVLTNGVFDVLHAGHVRYLKEAKALGDVLVVAINGDDSVRELKGPNRPVYQADERAEILCALEAVDRVVVFGEKRATGVIEAIQPHVYTKGGDYTAASLIDEERELMERLGTDIQILSLVEGKSTSATLKKLNAEDENLETAVRVRPRLALVGSGKGSNVEAIIKAINSGELEAEVVLIASDVADSGVLSIAKAYDLPGIHIEPGTDKGGQLTDAALKEMTDRIEAVQADLVILGGFMRVVRNPLLAAFENRILNIHPSLLPKFPGLHVCQKAIDAGESESGCSVHLVDAGVDTGKILGQASIPILDGDSADDLQARIQVEEHRLFPHVIADYWAELTNA